MKLTYWCAVRTDDAKCYSIIGKTKKEVVARVAANSWATYEPVKRLTIEYKDAFDLLDQATSEDGGRDCGYEG